MNCSVEQSGKDFEFRGQWVWVCVRVGSGSEGGGVRKTEE